MKLDLLAFAAHPDDIELSCCGTLMKEIDNGKKVGIIDLTEGELGSRGTVETRYEEAARSNKILGIHVRENLKLADGYFRHEREDQLKVIQALRKYQPDIILSNAIHDRHPDHGRGADILRDCFFLSGLRKVETELNGESQKPWRPNLHFHYIQDKYIEPDFIVDISDFWGRKKQAILAFNTQFSDGTNKEKITEDEPQTYISTPHFMNFIEARSKEFGHRLGSAHGEGFTVERTVGISSLFDLE